MHSVKTNNNNNTNTDFEARLFPVLESFEIEIFFNRSVWFYFTYFVANRPTNYKTMKLGNMVSWSLKVQTQPTTKFSKNIHFMLIYILVMICIQCLLKIFGLCVLWYYGSELYKVIYIYIYTHTKNVLLRQFLGQKSYVLPNSILFC